MIGLQHFFARVLAVLEGLIACRHIRPRIEIDQAAISATDGLEPVLRAPGRSLALAANHALSSHQYLLPAPSKHGSLARDSSK